MNAFDRHKMNFTAVCKDCNDVFDEIWTANAHHDHNGHKKKLLNSGLQAEDKIISIQTKFDQK